MISNQVFWNPSQNIQELEDYRIKVFKIDAALSTIPPVVSLTIVGYLVENNPWIILVCLGLVICIILTILLPSRGFFELAKVLRVLGVLFGTIIAEILFPFYQHEYLFLPVLVLTMILTYPFKNSRLSTTMLLSVTASILILVLIEDPTTYNATYASFNKVHLLAVMYSFFVSVWATALIQRKASKLILENQKQLEVSNVELHKYIDSNMQLETFAQRTAHDLKSPLRTIANYIQLLGSKLAGKTNPVEIEYFDTINSSVSRLTGFVDDLLHYAQVNAAPMKCENISLPGLIIELRQDLSYQLEDRDVKLELDLRVNDIFADRTKFKQILQNLVTNAIKYSTAPQPLVIIRSRNQLDFWHFSVEDNGIGVPEGLRHLLFQANVRLHQEQQYEGSGLGLYICKKIVLRHRGKIWHEEGNPGSKFMFTIAKNIE